MSMDSAIDDLYRGRIRVASRETWRGELPGGSSLASSLVDLVCHYRYQSVLSKTLY